MLLRLCFEKAVVTGLWQVNLGHDCIDLGHIVQKHYMKSQASNAANCLSHLFSIKGKGSSSLEKKDAILLQQRESMKQPKSTLKYLCSNDLLRVN